MKPTPLPFPGLPGYQLLDSGNGEKLERFGEWVLRRPDPQAIWAPKLDPWEWGKANLSFERESDRGGRWEGDAPKEWEMEVGSCKVMVRPKPFKHVGIFPEQASNWAWTEALREKLENEGVERPRMLNLFGYTGAASVLAAQAGWEVTHVDSSRASMDWAAENARLSDLPSDSIRWMLEDAMKFAGREVRREKHYHLVLLDPPAYGRGAKGEKWEFSDGIASLLEDCKTILEPSGSAGIVLSAYAIDFSALALSNLFSDWGGELEAGELALPEESENRFLPCGYCFRWSRV